MKRIAFAVGLVVLVFGVAMLAKTQTGSVEQEIIKLENEAGVAMVKGDVSFFERVVSEDYTWTDPDGNIWTKADFLASMKSGEDVVSSWNIDDYKVRVYGDAAVCLARVTSKEQYKGKDVSGQTRWTDTLIKRDGRWQFVASHSSRIPQK